jgi:hypothetical protein
MSSTIQILIGKVETYKRKFYLNQLIKGLIISFILIFLGFLSLNLIEYFVWLPSVFRMFLFYIFILFLLYVVVWFVVVPIFNLVGYNKKMSVEQAAVFIGKYFPEIDDRLLNTFQLGTNYAASLETDGLLAAAIEQRTKKLSVFKFENAVNMRENFRFTPYVLTIFLCIVVVSILSPAFFTEPSNRYIHYNQHFAKPLPFAVSLLTKDLNVMQYEDLNIDIEVTGEEIPDKFFIFFNGTTHLLEKKSTNNFGFHFTRLAESFTFHIESEEFKGIDYTIVVNPKPVLLSYQVEIDYPDYLQRIPEIIKEENFISVPTGSKLNWQFYTRDCQGVILQIDTIPVGLKSNNGRFDYSYTILNNQQLSVIPFNQNFTEKQGIDIIIEVINDNYPEIDVSLEKENLGKINYFTGIISDDYGFSDLRFEYKFFNATNETISEGNISVPFSTGLLQQQFYFTWNIDSVLMPENSRIEAYFVVFDNDRIGGPKQRKSSTFQLKLITDKEIDSLIRHDEKAIADQLDKLMIENKKLKFEYDELAKSLMMKEKLDWKDKNQLQAILDRQQKLQSNFEDLKEKQQSMMELNKDKNSTNERLAQKQEDIQKLFNDVIPEDLKKMMEELRELLKETDKDKVKEMLEKFKENSSDIEKMLDRDLALLNQLKVEKDLNELIEQLKKLSESVMNLGDSLKSGESKDKDLANEIEKNQDDFKKLTQELDSIQAKNQKLEQPFNLPPTEEKENSVNQKMEESKDKMSEGDMENAGEKQEEAGDEIEEMADQLAMSIEESMEEQLAEDAQQLRNLLENVLRASNEQEQLLNRVKSIDDDDPGFNEIVIKQKSLKDGFMVVEDSLIALAKRQVAIQQFVFDELKSIKNQFGISLSALNERYLAKVLESDQYTIMGLNNLALMLSEALNEMEQKMGKESSMGGKGKPKPGKGSGKSVKSMKQMQEALGKKMKQKGEQQGKSSGQGMTSEEFAKMAAEQEAIRQQLQQYLDELKKEGNLGEGGLQNAIKEMEKIEEDLVNKRLNREMIDRQQEIMSRLLESEKAEKERDQEERRESNEFKGDNKGNLGDKLSYKRLDKVQSDLLLKAPVELRPYYRTKANEYFMQINK